MFESDDWIFEDAFNDADEKTIHSHSRCQSKEKTSSVKRRKMDNYEISSSPVDKTFDSKLDTVADTEDNKLPYSSKSYKARGDLLLGIFKENTFQESFECTKEINKNLSSIQGETQCSQSSKINTTSNVLYYKGSKEKNYIKPMSKVVLDKEIKLIRIFPGPAGLVPDIKKDDISAVSYLNSMKELENETTTKHIKINLSKSQDEKNLFSETAWNLLLNDLPNNFLKEYGISIIKNKANASHCDSMKVKFIAGVLDYIDHSHEDPFIILKDSTGSIEGTIHRDIPLSYPNVLEPNVVILLHNVGLLKTTTYLVTNKYHILVSEINLLAIYSSKGRIVNAAHMENILSEISNNELNRDCMPISKSHVTSELQRIDENCDNTSWQISSSINISINDHKPTSENRKQAFKKNNEECKITDDIFERLNHSIDMDDLDMNDSFLSTDYGFISKDQNNTNHLSSETISQIKNNQEECKLQAWNTNHLENTKKEPVISFQSKIEKQNSPETVQKYIANVKAIDTHHLRESCPLSYDNIAHKDPNLNIKSALPIIKHNNENSKTLVSYFTSDNKYDSDDEILSQLDVDNIFSNY